MAEDDPQKKKISANLIMELRGLTSFKVIQCREALEACKGDLEAAERWLREKNGTPGTKIITRDAQEGTIGTYVHNKGVISVMVEVMCETDFVARNEEFVSLVHDLCLHIAAANPLAISRDQIDPEVIAQERQIFEAQASDKPSEIAEKIISGRLDKWFGERCLLEQRFVKDDKTTVGAIVSQKISKLAENIVVRRFVRWELGQ